MPGAENSSRFIILVVIDDFHVVSVSIAPEKADPPLIIDPNAVLALSPPPECFKPMTGVDGQRVQTRGSIQDLQLV